MRETPRAFHIGDVMSLVTGYVLSPRGPAGVEALVTYLAGGPVSSTDRLIYDQSFRAAVSRQYPELVPYSNDVPIPSELVPEWLRRRAAEFGEYLVLDRLPRESPVRQRAMASLENLPTL